MPRQIQPRDPRRKCLHYSRVARYCTAMGNRSLYRRANDSQLLMAVADAGGVGEILERVAGGETLRSIAEDLSRLAGAEVTGGRLGEWLRADPERAARLLKCRAQGADAFAEETIALADSAVSAEDAAVAKVKISTRQWIASKWAPSVYGDKAAQVQINIGEIHLDALRKVNAIMANSLPVNEIAGKLT